MIFHTTKRNVNIINLTINNAIIERVTQFDFLGFTINENVYWKDNITKFLTEFQEALVFEVNLNIFIPFRQNI